LPIKAAHKLDEEDFIESESNLDALDWVKKWPNLTKERISCIVGAKASGKTHLAHIWARRNNAIFLNECDGFHSVLLTIFDSGGNSFFVFDSADENVDELALFYMYNSVIENNSYLLMTAKTAPSTWNLSLADVKSRMHLVRVLNISTPNEEVLSKILKENLEKKGIHIKDRVIEYILSRIERSYDSILSLADLIDKNTSTLCRLNSRSIKFMIDQINSSTC
jgi:chromosomal replication initiation ATPase DnaA